MTHVDRHTAREARIQRISDGVVASYIHDIAAPRRRSRARREPTGRRQVLDAEMQSAAPSH